MNVQCFCNQNKKQDFNTHSNFQEQWILLLIHVICGWKFLIGKERKWAVESERLENQPIKKILFDANNTLEKMTKAVGCKMGVNGFYETNKGCNTTMEKSMMEFLVWVTRIKMVGASYHGS